MELPTWLNNLLTVIALFVAALSWLYAMKCWSFARDTEEYLKRIRPDESPSLKRVTQIEVELTELTDSLEAIHRSLKKLRARVGMRENRRRNTGGPDDIPDPVKDPAGYKTAMRLKLRGTGQLR